MNDAGPARDGGGPPTKLPAGRVEITLDSSQNVEAFELNLANAESIARFKDGAEARVFVNAAGVQEPVALVRIPGLSPWPVSPHPVLLPQWGRRCPQGG